MGAVMSYVSKFYIDQGRTDDADPTTGLTSRDRYLITNSWNKVMEQPTAAGVTFFMKLFEVQPKHQLAFPFKDLPTETLPTNRKFQAHVNGVMYSVSSVVSNLHDPEVLVAVIHKIGKSHAYRSVDHQALVDVKTALLDIFHFMTAEELNSWSKMLDYFIMEGTKAVVEELSKNSTKNSK